MENSSDTSPPHPYAKADVQRGLRHWAELVQQQKDADLQRWMESAAADGGTFKPLLETVFGNSPYVSRLLFLYPGILLNIALHGADATVEKIIAELSAADDYTALMRHLRIGKGKLALAVALADIMHIWALEKVTAALSEFAQKSLMLAVDEILRTAHKRGDIALAHPDSPSENSGIIVLGMGKLGGFELNYSSDIDLILFYEPGRLTYASGRNEQRFMTRLAHDLVTIMQERTAQGYVFRTDLRLRPDPASTPPAITTEAAYYYYESVGQNWERAAMIKARPVAGDIVAGERFLQGITPFMWRRNLDFAAINDIHSIKRQMDGSARKTIQLKGHNIKLGMGGIREIEFYAQIHQLIWGGHDARLRTRATCETLHKLASAGLVEADKESLLIEAYRYFRTLEHRLQMVADEQTHSLPESDEGFAHIACFMGYDNVGAFEKELLGYLQRVHEIYASSFKNTEGLGAEGNLVFTGPQHDPDTLATLRSMGYSAPETISEIVMSWHHGSRRATRSKRARELLTELMPVLLRRLSETAHPDSAFLKFNEFLVNLPSGVQLFSLFNANPHLLGLIADIMGSAPTLAESLSKSPELLDAVLYEDFYGNLPAPKLLTQQLKETLAQAHGFEDAMNRLRHFRNEKQFQAGVQLLKGMIDSETTGVFLSHLADLMVQHALAAVTAEFSKSYGTIAASSFAVIALGKLGSMEMTFSSDIDLVFIYDAPDADALSDGEKKFTASVYYNRLAQRLLGALSALGRDGRLYEVDTRLRPSGEQGLLAVSIDALAHYFDESAWTFEYMAFTKARVIESAPPLRKKLEAFIRAQLTKPRDGEKLRRDVADMRERIDKEHGSDDPWNLKYVRGGLMDIDFIAQYLMLLHAPDTPGAKPSGATDIFGWLGHSGRMTPDTAQELRDADRFMGRIFNTLRLCSDHAFSESSAPAGLKKLLVDAVKASDFAALRARLIQVEQYVHRHYIECLKLQKP